MLVGTLLYIVLRLVLRKRVSAALQPLVKNTNSDLLDEIGYRSIAIGFPVFTLGALIFAMIWAQIAWTRFGAGIQKRFGHLSLGSFMRVLHLRLSKGWHGEKSAWLAVMVLQSLCLTLL